MIESPPDDRAKKLGFSLKVLALIDLLVGVLLAAGALLILRDAFHLVISEELMIGPWTLSLAAGSLIFMVILSGMVSFLRIPWGWFIPILTATLLIVMTLLTEPRTLWITKAAFLAMPLLAVLLWITGLVYYFYDLYR
ncbi:MAG: hypothetical protein JSV26_05635 [bacterium]|nr:MAG: hypothetical protein JSV26_05635 [bacterium]